MLDEKLIPTPLGDRPYHRKVPVADKRRRLRWRTWYLFRELFWLAARGIWLKLTGKLTDTMLGQMVADACERQGVLWVKVGQLMSMRNDALSPEFCAALSKLHDRASGSTAEEAKRQVEHELGNSIDHYFSEFNPVPIAAASIAQVQLARLKENGVAVAVKIQRPDAAKTVKIDLVIFERLIDLLKWVGFKSRMRWDDLLWEIRHVMREELDFRIEASNMRRMRKRLRRHKIYVPKLFPQFTTERILVMEFIDGPAMSEYLRYQQDDPEELARWRQVNNVVPDKVGRRLLWSYLQQLFEDRLFHSDMHPGNILLLRNSRLAVIDFGSIGFLERDLLRKYDSYLEALGRGNYSKAVDMLMMTTNSLPPTNLSTLKDELLQITRDWESRCRVEGLDYDQTSASGLLDETVRRGMQWGLDQNWTFLKVIRSWATMDVSLRALLSDTDLKGLLVRYYQQRQRRQRLELLQIRPIAARDVEKALDFGEAAIENAFLRGTLLRRVGQVFEGATTKVHQFFAIGFGLTAAGLMGLETFLLAVLIDKYYKLLPATSPPGPVGNFIDQVLALDGQIWAVGLITIAYLAWTFLILRWRFLEAEENTSYL